MSSKHILFLLVGSMFFTNVVSQEKYFIAFANKNGTPYSIETPGEFLSQQSIERREKQ